jgi:cardiolipin synthase A/B
MRIVLLVVLTLAGCASLPEVHPLYSASGARTPTVAGARGILSPERAQAVLARATQGSDSDVLRRHLVLEEEIAGTPLTVGNSVQLLSDGPATYQSMFAEIAKARDHINLEFYIFEGDETGQRFADALLKKAAEGVAVALMYDSVGSLQTKPEFFEQLRAGGVRVLQYNPVNPLQARAGWSVNQRNHRKSLIVDGQSAFVGGINVSDVYSSGPSRAGSRFSGSGSAPRLSAKERAKQPGWRDTNVRIEGPAVAQLQRLFLDTWQQQNGEALPARQWFPPMKAVGKHPVRVIASGPDDDVPAIYVTTVSAIMRAEQSVHVTMAYFIPDPQTLEALTSAAQRGVDVKLVLPSYSDFWAVFHAGRSHYGDLLQAGVKIYERQEALLHAKTVAVDGVWSSVGSSNLDWRSFLHNLEVNAVVLGPEFGRQMETMFSRDVAESKEITLEAWQRRPLGVRMKEIAARVWEYWL